MGESAVSSVHDGAALGEEEVAVQNAHFGTCALFGGFKQKLRSLAAAACG
jgi:hypothetical protein